MNKSYKFFHHNKCEYFPCHDIEKGKEKDFNCLMCFCPLYPYDDCGGCYTLLPSGIKDCSQCVIPHYSYDYIVDEIVKRNKS